MDKEKLEELKRLVNNKEKSYLKTDVKDKKDEYKFTGNLEKLKQLEELDKVKSRILKYIVYKKRTEIEIRNKFKGVFDENIFEDAIENLKDLGYINDTDYIDRAVKEYMSLKNMSIKEIKYKLLCKGLDKGLVEDYILDRQDELLEFETKSAENIFLKKKNSLEEKDIENYLRKKGYLEESIKNAKYLYNGDN